MGRSIFKFASAAAGGLAGAAALTLVAVWSPSWAEEFSITGTNGSRVQASVVTAFDEPWAMTFLPDGTLLVSTKPGVLFHVTQQGEKTEVGGLWEVAYGGQGGLGDVVLHPNFAQNGMVYISNAEAGNRGTRGAVVWRAKLDRSGGAPRLVAPERIWTQEPKTTGAGHYSHRIAFGPDGMLYITSGDRQKMAPAQDFRAGLGKVIRLHDDGRVPVDNPWQDKGELAKTFWSMGHRNLLGIAFDGQGRLWTHEMGPRHGDELNLVVPGGNYGWPEVSNGNHYSGIPIPDHHTRPDFNPPKAYWVPAISPAGFAIYDGSVFPQWRGNGFLGGLSSRALVRVTVEGENAQEAERFEWGARVREVEQGPNGALWLLEDRDNGRLLKLTPGS
ncbi:MAG: PQQ-dependent sugar dehydrogenase [Magnetospiraceae bacterium]